MSQGSGMTNSTPATNPTARGGDALRPYQQEAVDFLHEKKSAVLALDMGL